MEYLPPGTRVTVGSKLASEFSYTAIVGKEVTIMRHSYTDRGTLNSYYVETDNYEGWFIRLKDAIPKPKNNEDTYLKLKEEDCIE